MVYFVFLFLNLLQPAVARELFRKNSGINAGVWQPVANDYSLREINHKPQAIQRVNLLKDRGTGSDKHV